MTDQKQGRKTSYLRAVSGDMTETPEDLSTNEQSFPSKFYGDRTEGANTEKSLGVRTAESFFVGANSEQDCNGDALEEKVESWRDFSEYTTLHGFHFVLERKRLFWVRVIWTTLLVICAGYVIFSLCFSIMKFFSYPIATVLSIKYPSDSMAFPAVTLCPLTTVTKSKASMTDDNSRFDELGLNVSVCKATETVRAGRPCGEALLCCCASIVGNPRYFLDNCTEEYKNELLEAINASYLSFNGREFFGAFGRSISEMIIPKTYACWFGSSDMRCSHKDFVPVFTDMGMCYSFNSERGEKTLNVTYGDVTSGFFLMLDLNVEDHLYGPASDGVRVLVHNQGEYVNAWNGALVGPGTHAQFTVTKKVYRNKEAPYETNCDDFIELANFPTYTSEGCDYECISNATFETCKCRAIGATANPDDRVCSRQDDECVYQEIVRKLLARIDETCPFYSSFEERLVITSFEALTQNENVRSLVEGDKKCHCPVACDVHSYETTLSTASFPNPSMIRTLRNGGYNKTKDYFRENFVYLQVGYKAFRYEYFRQKAQYDSGALLGEIGGNMGLFLGSSILTVCEFVHFVIYLCHIRHKKKA